MNYLYYSPELEYPQSDSFSPSEFYPEYPFNSYGNGQNKVYDAIRKMLYYMGLDKEKYGTKDWNPLGKYIKPGMRVVLKPNFVMHRNGSNDPEDMESLVTHASIIRCVVDYCYIALGKEGEVIVGDAPVKDCNFNVLMKKGHYDKINAFYNNIQNFKVTFVDFRGPEEESDKFTSFGEGVLVNLAEKSWFYNSGHDESKYRIPNYDYRNVIKHHAGKTQEYMINSVVLDADVVISIPKPKTHRKNGYTAALKNFVGINYSKEYLPHHTEGATNQGGDEFRNSGIMRVVISRLRRNADVIRTEIAQYKKCNDLKHIKKFLMKQKVYWTTIKVLSKIDRMNVKKQSKRGELSELAREGCWFGNDTLWRTVLDLNHVLLYADRNGVVHNEQQRVVLHLGDMIVSGEKEGPMAPLHKEEHILLFSENMVSFDAIVTKVMGFNYRKFVGLSKALLYDKLRECDYNEIIVQSNYDNFDGKLSGIDFTELTPFEPSMGWKGYVEL